MKRKQKAPTRKALLAFLTALERGVPLDREAQQFADNTLRPLWSKARKASKLALFERTCETRLHKGRQVKTWRIPNTYAASVHEELFAKAVSLFTTSTQGLLKKGGRP